MKLPRASMSMALFVILIFAVDFGVARDLMTHDRGSLSTYGLGFLPMATLLVFGLYRLARLRVRAGAFTGGFVAVGLVASGGYLAAIRLVPALTDVLERLSQALDDRLLAAFPTFWEGDDLGLDELLVLGTILSIPPGLLALAGGWFARRIALGWGADSRQRERPRAWKRPRFTLASASILVAVLAVDFGLIQHLVRAVDSGSNLDRPISAWGPWLGFLTPWGVAILNRWVLFAIGFLPMANLLFLGLPGVLRSWRRSGSFLLGFEVVGWLATVAYLAACAVVPESMMRSYHVFGGAVEGAIDLALGGGRTQQFWQNPSYASLAAAVVLCAAFFTLPPLGAAFSGGAITRRFGRRPARAA